MIGVALAGCERAVITEKRAAGRDEDRFTIPRIPVDALTGRARFKHRLSAAAGALLRKSGAARNG